MTGRRGRRRGREAALQLLYQCEVGGLELPAACRLLWKVRRLEAVDRAFAEQLAREVLAEQPRLDQLIADHAEHWRLSRMAVVDRLILRLGTWELLGHPDTPPAVVINEAVELARTFSSAEAPAFVNGVLDAIRRTLAARAASSTAPDDAGSAPPADSLGGTAGRRGGAQDDHA